MIAERDVTALHNGVRYSYKKGQRVDAPAALLETLKEIGAVKETKRKASDD